MKISDQLQYQEFLPSPAMTQYLAGHWKFVVPANWDGPLEHIAPPDGCVSLCKKNPFERPKRSKGHLESYFASFMVLLIE